MHNQHLNLSSDHDLEDHSVRGVKGFFKLHANNTTTRKDIIVSINDDQSIVLTRGNTVVETGDVVKSELTEFSKTQVAKLTLTSKRLVWFKTPSGQKVQLDSVDQGLNHIVSVIDTSGVYCSFFPLDNGIIFVLEQKDSQSQITLADAANSIKTQLKSLMKDKVIPRFPFITTAHTSALDGKLKEHTHFGKSLTSSLARKNYHREQFQSNHLCSPRTGSILPDGYTHIDLNRPTHAFASEIHQDVTHFLAMCGPKNSAGTEVLDKEHIQLDATITELGFGSKEFMDFITKVSVVYEEKVPDNQKVSLKTEIATLIQDPDKTIEEIISGLSRISICYDLNLKPTQTLKPDSTHTELVIESGWQLRRIANHSTFSIVCPDMSGRTAWFLSNYRRII